MKSSRSPTVRRVRRGARLFLAVVGTVLLLSSNFPSITQALTDKFEPAHRVSEAANLSNATITQQAVGDISTIAGNGLPGFNGDGGPAINASLNFPIGIAADNADNLFILDLKNNRVRKIAADSGIITTVAGNGDSGYSGDGGLAVNASLNVFTGNSGSGGIAVDGDGTLFIADTFNQRVRRVDPTTRIITTVAGNGEAGFSGDGIPATSASLNYPLDVALDQEGNLLIADAANQRIRQVDVQTGMITTIAGNGETGFSGDGGPPTSASLNIPAGLDIDLSGNFSFSDAGNRRIRQVDVTTGLIDTVAGNGSFGAQGDGGLAINASFGTITGVTVDGGGNLFLVDESFSRVRRVDALTGIITTVAGNGTVGYTGDGGPATNASLNFPIGSAVNRAGDLIITDKGNNVIRAVQGIAITRNLPQIHGAEVIGKKLYVYGTNFRDGVKLFMNGEKQKKTFPDELNPTTLLIANKAGKLIAPGDTVMLQVRNSDGRFSNPYMFTRATP